jgi:hypothetical protein
VPSTQILLFLHMASRGDVKSHHTSVFIIIILLIMGVDTGRRHLLGGPLKLAGLIN